MNLWLAWLGILIAAILLPVVGVLLYRALSHQTAPPRRTAAEKPRFVPAQTDETIVISREQADEMLNK